jgi:hypothetical protein
MTDEQIESKKEHAGEKKASMKRRDDHHDYTERRMYMITLEVEGRRPVFGRVVGDAFAPKGRKDEPRMELTQLGQAVQNEWMGIHGYYPQIEVMAVQMMPDHMHGILFVREQLPVHLGQVISGFKAGCRKAEKALIAATKPQPTENRTGVMQQQPTENSTGVTATKPQPAGKRLLSSQQVTALPLQESRGSFPVEQESSLTYRPLFAKGYNDLILRSYDELSAWKNYLHDNPRRLLMKRARPEWLRPFFGLKIGQHSYSGIGNRGLLMAIKREAVRVSRRLSEEEIDKEVQRYLEEARQGAVLVSPAISPGEKRVMRAAFDAGLPTIVIVENGFTPLSKPHGEQFYACGHGSLLMLSPWEHHNEKRKLTAAQCTEMNLMALEICSIGGR